MYLKNKLFLVNRTRGSRT